MIACKAVRRSETPSLKISIWKATLVDKMLDIELSIKKRITTIILYLGILGIGSGNVDVFNNVFYS